MDLEFTNKRLFTLPVRVRENHLAEAAEWDILLDNILIALRSGGQNEKLALEILERKAYLVQQLEALAEYGYKNTLRRRALYITEQATGIEAVDLIAQIESRMLEISTSITRM